MVARYILLGAFLLSACAFAQGPAILQNGGFEALTEVRPGADGLVAGWKMGQPPQVPKGWHLNSAYPGQLAIGSDKPHSGKSFVRITASEKTTAHLYQTCVGLEAGKWYRVSAWARGGAVALEFYEYFKDGHIGGQGVAQLTRAGDEWRLLTGFYRPSTGGYVQSALAIVVSPGQSADVDDVTIEPLSLPETPASAADITIENDLLRLTLSPQGLVREFRCKTLSEPWQTRRIT